MRKKKTFVYLFLALLLGITKSNGQALNITSGGQTGTSGTNWSLTDNGTLVTITNTGTATINTSVIQGALNQGKNVLVANSGAGVFGINIQTTIEKTSGSSNRLTFKSNGIVTVSNNIKSSSGAMDIILWADADNSQNGPNQANDQIEISPGVSLESNGGLIVLAGGPDNGANGGTSNDGIPDNYAYRGTGNSLGAVNLGPPAGTGTVISLLSSGGDIIIRGLSRASTTNARPGIVSQANLKIDAGSGRIDMQGISSVSNGIEFTFGATPNIAITSSYSGSGPAIRLAGATVNSHLSIFLVNNSGGNFLIQSTSTTGGGVLFQAHNGTSNGNTAVLLLPDGSNTNLQILSGSGDIVVENAQVDASFGSSQGIIRNLGTIRYGTRANTTAVQGITPAVTSSNANVIFRGNDIQFETGTPTTNIVSTGKFILEPLAADNSFTSAITFRNVNLGTTLNEVRIGKATNSANITLSSAITANGPISVYGGTITINEDLSSSNGSSISLYGNGLTFGSGKTVTSTGQLIVAPQAASNTIGLGGASGTLQLPASYFSTHFSDGFSNIQIGSNDQTGNISANAFTLRDNMTLLTSGSLTLGGKPVLGNNNLSLGEAITTINVGSPANYFQTTGTGKVIRNIATGTNRLFPIGNAAYNPVTVANNTGAADVFSIKVRDQVLEDGVSGTAMAAPHVNVTWDIVKSNANASSGVDFTLQWESSQEQNSITTFALNHYNGTAWEFAAGTSGSVGVNGNTKTMTHNGYTGTFSPFAIGGGATPLPVDLLRFDATLQQNNALLSWATTSEVNNQGFEIEKSTNDTYWESIGFVAGAGNSFTTQQYQFVDYNFQRFALYRLKQVDWDGNHTYSPVRMLQANAVSSSDKVWVYPNPSKGSVAVTLDHIGTVQYAVYDVAGKRITGDKANQRFQINHLSAGVYYLHIEGASLNERRMIIVE